MEKFQVILRQMGDSFTANMSNWEEIEPTFTQIVKEKLPGSEGPVFDRNGKFFMVAPEVMEGENFAGQVVTVDLETGKVCQNNCHALFLWQ